MQYAANTSGGISCYFKRPPVSPDAKICVSSSSLNISTKTGVPYLADAKTIKHFSINGNLSNSVYKACARVGFVSALCTAAGIGMKLITQGNPIIGSSILIGGSILTYLFEKTRWNIAETYTKLKSPTKSLAVISTVAGVAIPILVSLTTGIALAPTLGAGLVIHTCTMTALKRYNQYLYGYWNFSRLRAEEYEYEINLWRSALLELLRERHPDSPQLVKSIFEGNAQLFSRVSWQHPRVHELPHE